ncbi:hypothetical protein ACHAWF_001452, partial [Thalassiosira exigua]
DNCWDHGGYCCSDGNWYVGNDIDPINPLPNSCEDRGLKDSQVCEVDPIPVPTPAPYDDGDDGAGGTPMDTPMPIKSLTPPSPGTMTPPPVPVVDVVCAVGETCTVEGDTCTDGSTEECCGETFESFVCECEAGSDGELTFQCMFTDACLGKPNVVGCTAVDPNNFVDKCDALDEPCPNANTGEFCCLDGCPRNYCTAKQKPMSLVIELVPLTTANATIMELIPLNTDDMSREVTHALKRIKRQEDNATP